MKFLNGINCVQFLAFLTITLFACSNGPEAIQFGKDNCASCKMTISDARFGLELITVKGKCYKFDDVHCLRAFIQSGHLANAMVKKIYVVDFAGKNELLDVSNAMFLLGEEIKSPMGGNVAAFSDQKDKDAAAASLHAKEIKWEALNVFPQ